ncbi:MAG: outer membrane beta-barrel domain-containing protein, partial [Cellvibrionaceae bacterium]
ATESRVRVIEPESRVVEARPAAIDDERFQLGLYLGNLSVEDFGSDLVSGIELSYHLADSWLLQLNYGKASIDRAAFETSQRQFLSSDDRNFEYLAAVGGYRLLHGRSFFGVRNKYNTDIYALAGPEQVSFSGNDETGLVFGLSYRVVFTDWMTFNMDFREHMFKRDFIGDSKQTLNTEFRIGINALF